jgi:GT2 family glycosyltransferase
MSPSVSVVIPVYNGAPYLQACLEGVARLDPPPLECIVVDDGSTDGSAAIAKRAGVKALSCGSRRRCGYARNLGAKAARGEIVLFLDADVVAPPGVIARILERFAEDPRRDAVIGSYDDEPGDPGFFSQYRNLLHTFTHQTGHSRSVTFWAGCGAIRRSVFLACGGFRESLTSMEDVDCGFRLRRAGREIWLDKGLRVKHLKALGFFEIVKTDLFGRALPWTRLILRYRSMPADLNLQWTQRLSVALVSLGAAAVPVAGALWAADAVPAEAVAGGAAIGAAAVGHLNRDFYRFLARRKGFWFAVRAFPMHCLHYLCGGVGFAAGLALHLAALPGRVEASRRSSASRRDGAGSPEPAPPVDLSPECRN